MLQALNRDVLHCWQSVMWCCDRSRKGCLLTVCSLKADLTEDAVVDVLLSDTATSNTSFRNECRDLVTPVTRQSRQLTSGQGEKSTPLPNKPSISCQKLTPQTISPDTKPVRCREDEESTRGLKGKETDGGRERWGCLKNIQEDKKGNCKWKSEIDKRLQKMIIFFLKRQS